MNRNERILVIDDDPGILGMLERLLVSKGYTVDLASGSGEAHGKMMENSYGVILLDARLPGMSGLELLKYCRSISPETEIIMITGNPELQDAIRTVKDGAFDYIAKPFSAAKLLERIDDALNHREKREIPADDDDGKPSSPLPIDGYDYIRRIGTGQMGVVVLLEQDGKEYAMKILRKADTNEITQERVGRFLREVEILESLSHPNIVKIYKCGFSSTGIPYILMEYVDGKPLSKLIAQGTLDFECKLKIMRDLADALNAVHSLDVLHRDIKPGNILVTGNCIAKLTDFGIARMSDSSLTLTHEVLGSPAYMAPEAFRHANEPDVRSDLFSLGVTYYELFTGKKPFTAENVPQMMDAVSNELPVAPSKITENLPHGLELIIGRLMCKNPDSRYQNAAELLKDIDLMRSGKLMAGKRLISRLISFLRGERFWK